DPVVERAREAPIVARTERAALAAELGVAAEDPVAALDSKRLRAVVEAGVREVAQIIALDDIVIAAEVRVRVKNRADAPVVRTVLRRHERGRRQRGHGGEQ